MLGVGERNDEWIRPKETGFPIKTTGKPTGHSSGLKNGLHRPGLPASTSLRFFG